MGLIDDQAFHFQTGYSLTGFSCALRDELVGAQALKAS